METFSSPRRFVHHPGFSEERDRVLAGLNPEDIDPPIRGLIAAFARLPQCFTLQCCFGHFVHREQQDPHNLEPLPDHDVGPITYRIAYIALCLENSAAGRAMRSALENVPAIDPEYIQFGSADWFWQRHRNSYALQVEPSRFMDRDQAIIDHREAFHLQRVRHHFFHSLTGVVAAANSDGRAES